MAKSKSNTLLRVKSKNIKFFSYGDNDKITGVNYTPSMYENGLEFTVTLTQQFDLYRSERGFFYVKDWLIFLDEEDTLFKFD